MSKTKIGVIGNGFVGEAISFAFSSVADMYIYDIDSLRCFSDIESSKVYKFIFLIRKFSKT